MTDVGLAGTDDAALLAAAAAGDEEAFATFYRRHLPAITGFHLRRTGRREIAFDLTAETFAAVVVACGDYDPSRGTATGWLFGIAANKLRQSLRRGRVEAAARRRLGHAPITIDDEDLARVDELASQADEARVAALLAELPAATRSRHASSTSAHTRRSPPVGGVATAATQLRHGSSNQESARSLAFQAVKDTRNAPACRLADRHDAPIVDEAPPPELAAALPDLAAAPAAVPGATLAFVRRYAGGPVLGRTLRLIPVGGGRRLLVYVAHGNGGFTLTDPAGCLRARRARLAKLAPDPDEHNAAERVLAQMRDTMPGAQTLDISILAPGKAAPGAGTGIPLTAGQDLPTGVVLSGGGVYVGIAKPDVTSIALRSARTRSVRRSVAVHHGLFAFSLPRHTGPVVLTQRTADGRPITMQRIRQ